MNAESREMHKAIKATEAPRRYPAPALDRILHLARCLHDGQSRSVVTFSGSLDTERMARAFRLSLDAEPVLGCRFVAHPWRPYWERLPDAKLVSPLSVVETGSENSLHDWLAGPLDASADIQVRACLFRGSKEKLAVKLSHEAADASGMLDYLNLVAAIYRELRTNPGYVPLRREGRLGQGPVLRSAGFRQLLRGCLHFSSPGPGVDSPVETLGEPVFALRRIEPETVARILEYCRKHDVTVNEVVLAAFYRAEFARSAAPPYTTLTIPVPINLRRFLPAGSKWGVCNLSAVFFAGMRNQSFDAMVASVHRLMASARSDTPWLGQAVLLELMFLLPYAVIARLVRRSILRQIASGRLYPYIANHGIIDTAGIDFEGVPVSDFETWSPVPNHTVPMLGVYTVGGALMVAMVTRDRPNGRKADQFLDAYLKELPGQCFPTAYKERDTA